MASLIVPSLRRLAIRAPKSSLATSSLLRQSFTTQTRLVTNPVSTSPSRILNAVRTRAYATTTADAQPVSHIVEQAKEQAKSGKKSWPETNSKAVGYWLVGSAVSVFGIVVFGGLTRLTESGLSITEWRPVTGSMFPTTDAHWQSEFEKYRASPEFALLNPHMTLAEFKKIYFMEWFHRLWGRFIGLSFVLPTLYFIARKQVTKKMAVNLMGISCMIGFQGVIGWWMVKSGLKDDLFAPGSHPRVSQYRLTTHLAAAFVCYSWMLLTALSIFRTRRFLADPASAMKAITAVKAPAVQPFRRAALLTTVLVAITCLSGALVAGLDAGLIYNEFPKMGLGLTPPASELWNPFYCRDPEHKDLWWRNMLENPSTVQLDHRIMAMTTFTAIVTLWAVSRRKAALPTNVKKGALGLVHLVCMQAALGISTLIYLVPIPLASAHQAGSMLVLSGALLLCHRLHVPGPTVRMLQRKVKELQK